MIKRPQLSEIAASLRKYPVVGLIGSRQTGKTTLAKMISQKLGLKSIYLDLELPSDMNKLQSPELYLRQFSDTLHVPRAPHPRFVGKSGCGARGDVIVQFDWCVGEILNVLDRLQLARRTLVILSSDNGPVVDDGYRDGAVENLGDHRPAGPLRGGKYSNFEGGTRVPFLVTPLA